VKRSCNTHAVAYYGLKRGCGDDAKDLLDKKVYIYPVENSKACNTAADRICADGDSFSQRQHTKPYSHGIFLAILADTIFKGDNSTAYKLRDQFFSSLEDLEDELEIPKPMLAYIATGVYPFLASMEALLTSPTGTRGHSGMGNRRAPSKVLCCAFDHSYL
jgi:hypothetical protein